MFATLIRFSRNNIRGFLVSRSKGYGQISQEYTTDAKKYDTMIDSITDVIIDWRNSCLTADEVKMVSFFEYLHSNKNPYNSQIRGPQVHISQEIFEACYNISSINIMSFNAFNLANLIPVYTKFAPNVHYPKTFFKTNSLSFRQGIEATGAKVVSGITGNTVIITDDDPNNIPSLNVMYNNTNQPVADYVRRIKLKPYTVGCLEDNKQKSGGAILRPNYIEPGVYNAGGMPLDEEKTMMQNLARQAIMGVIPVTHMVSNNNKDKIMGLQKSGMVEDSTDFVGMPRIITNRHYDPDNYSNIP